ncbi:hypothetical protein OB955_19245 [Halobacteria archaeon AArc-m2/3/4]|uniref:Uncharacterized protein n=1 Tax=Natronoglomus mannanivorans TaxID=2979990 RepID=A0ABT2QIX6_9EURY|nr:hypothetical protein [Halobacteria archaeon AArc-m2/3/4]
MDDEIRYCPSCGVDQYEDLDEIQQTKSDDSEPKERKFTFGRILAWIAAPIILLLGLTLLISDPFSGILLILVGLFTLPLTRVRLRDDHGITFSRWVVLTIVLVGLIGAGGMIDGDEDIAGPGDTNGEEAAVAAGDDAEATADEEASDANEEAAANEDEEVAEEDGLQVRILYDGDWSGAVGEEGSTQSVEGNGDETLDVSDDAMIVSATAQKQDASDDELVVQILNDGEIIEEGSTTADYGVVGISVVV